MIQDVESKFCGRLSHVCSQPAMIPSSRALLTRDKRLPLDTWNHSGLQENVLEINFLRLIHPEIIVKEFILARSQRERGSVPQATGPGTLFARDD